MDKTTETSIAELLKSVLGDTIRRLVILIIDAMSYQDTYTLDKYG